MERPSEAYSAAGLLGAPQTFTSVRLHVCENLQCLAARYGRRSSDGGLDFYGGEELLEGLAKHLRDQGVLETAVQAQLARLKVADADCQTL